MVEGSTRVSVRALRVDKRSAAPIAPLRLTNLAINLRLGEQKSDDYKALNPNETVPLLVVDGQGIGQSTAIIEYLEDTHSSPSIYPTSALLASTSRCTPPVLFTPPHALRSEEHTPELQSLMSISYAVFCLKKKNNTETQ